MSWLSVKTRCFNLVIEVLLISRSHTGRDVRKSYIMFQSRNRGSFDFKLSQAFERSASFKFQSRNRGSFDFKNSLVWMGCYLLSTFQSRNRGSFDFKKQKAEFCILFCLMFQSRNRGSFDFKIDSRTCSLPQRQSFNLVIEVLLISRTSDSQGISW